MKKKNDGRTIHTRGKYRIDDGHVGMMKWTDSLVRVLALSGQSAAEALAGAALQPCLGGLLVPVEATQSGLEAYWGHTGSCNNKFDLTDCTHFSMI